MHAKTCVGTDTVFARKRRVELTGLSAQFYSRIGFLHEFRPLTSQEIGELLDQHWTPPGVHLPRYQLDSETGAAIIRLTGGNFRLLNRLPPKWSEFLKSMGYKR